MLMRQDLCRPKRTYPDLSLAFIRLGEKGGRRQHWREKEREREEREGGRKTESMPSIKQEGLCALKLV